MIKATESDVVACYRLILGREPDPHGARGFFELIAGERFLLDDLVELFWKSPEALARRAIREAAKNRLQMVELDGFRMTVAPDWNQINRGIAANRAYEPHITVHLRRLLSSGKVFVDVGANIGYYSLLAAAKGASVHAFEPNGRNLWLLSKNARDNQFSLQIYPNVVAETERLVIYSPLEGNGQIAELDDRFPSAEQEVLRSVTLDKALAGIEPNIIKIDVEGAEGLVISGAKTIMASRPIVVSEFSASGIPAISRMSAADYLNEFVRRGYKLHLCQLNGELSELSARELESASLRSGANLVDFIAVPT